MLWGGHLKKSQRNMREKREGDKGKKLIPFAFGTDMCLYLCIDTVVD